MKQTGKLLRTLAALLALLLLCGCGAQEAAQPQGAEAPQPEVQEAETAETQEPEAAETQEPEAAETQEPAPTEAPAPTLEPVTVSVSNVDELLDAIAPNTVIEMAPGVYDLSVAVNYGRLDASPYYTWNMAPTYDEPEFGLEIHDVEGLTIRGAGRGVSFLNALPRYVFVITFRNCSGVSVEGITAGHSPDRGECMGGVLDFEACTGAKVHYALFQANDTDGFVVTNCSVYSNRANYLFLSTGSRNCFFLSDRVSNNVLVYGFQNYDNPCVVDGCSFSGPEGAVYAWASPDGLPPADLAGKSLSERELFSMAYAAIDPAGRLPLREEPGPEQTITVTTADEFLDAIGPNRTIVLDGEVFDLSAAKGFGVSESPYYRWSSCYDGPELVISWVSDLHIRAAGDDPAATTLVTSPRYANVLSFCGCHDVSLEGFTLGHTQAPGSCAGGVVDFRYGSGLALTDCRLYGCGVLGLNATDSSRISLERCEIYDCSDGGVLFYEVQDASFLDCDIHDVPSPALALYNCLRVTWNGEAQQGGQYNVDRHDGSLIPLPSDLSYAELREDFPLEELCIFYQNQELLSLELKEQDSVILTAKGFGRYGQQAQMPSVWSCDGTAYLQLTPINGGRQCIVKALKAADGDLTLSADCGNGRCEIPVRISAR